jgi:hypothetical protein
MTCHFECSLTSSCRADYAEDEYIQELLLWRDPELVDSAECIFTESENMSMLNLPRKECKRYALSG